MWYAILESKNRVVRNSQFASQCGTQFSKSAIFDNFLLIPDANWGADREAHELMPSSHSRSHTPSAEDSRIGRQGRAGKDKTQEAGRWELIWTSW
jgi:hypothetical protein